MTYTPITTVNITLQPAGVTAEGFSTILFIADVDTSTNPDPLGAGVRVKTYTSVEEALNDWITSDAAYKAVEQAFSVTPKPAQIKVAYRDVAAGAEETPAEAVAAANDYDSDWYFLTAESHDAAVVADYDTAIQAYNKLYIFSSQEQTSLTAYDEGVSTDALAVVKGANNDRTKGFFHHLADTEYPEVYWAAYNSVFPAGSVNWENIIVNLPVAQDPSTGLPLSSTQKGYLEDRNAAYTERLGANQVIIRNARTASGQWMDFIHGRDKLAEDINVALKNLLSRQKGGKLPYTNAGITQIMSTVDNVLNLYTTNPYNFISEGYKLSFKMRNEIPDADVEARIYRQGSFSAQLQSAINGATINGVLSITI